MIQNWFDINNPQIINGKFNGADDRHNNYELERLLLSPTSITSSPVAVVDSATTSVKTLVLAPPSSSSSSHTTTLQSLSRNSSSEDMSCALEKSEEASTRNGTSCLTPKSTDAAPLVDTSDANSLTKYRCKITYQNSNVLREHLKLSSNVEQKRSRNPIINSEEEEIAFLRSLGWEENNEFDDNEGLTQQEILEFYDKYAQNCSYDHIFSKLSIKT